MPRKTIYLAEDIMPIIGCSEHRGFSARITNIIKDWNHVIEESMPELTVDEWLFMIEMLSDVGYELSASNINVYADQNIGKDWQIDKCSLSRRVKTLRTASKAAIHDVAYRFWQRHRVIGDYRETLEQCGAKIRANPSC